MQALILTAGMSFGVAIGRGGEFMNLIGMIAGGVFVGHVIGFVVYLAIEKFEA